MFSHYSLFIPLVLVLFVWGTFVTLRYSNQYFVLGFFEILLNISVADNCETEDKIHTITYKQIAKQRLDSNLNYSIDDTHYL